MFLLETHMTLPWILISLTLISPTLTSIITPLNMLTSPKTSKPNCPQNCGKLTIPYPFGIGSSCSLHSWFSIKCNTSYNPPRAFFENGLGSSGENPEILGITDSHIVIRNFKNQIAFKCYNFIGNKTSAYVGVFDMGGFPFSYSSTANQLVVVGCDDFAEIHAEGTLKNGNQFNYTTGCLAMCSTTSTMNAKVLQAGPCSGSLCCQTAIPVGTQSFKIILSPLVRTLYFTQHCGYAFLAVNDSFKYSEVSNLTVRPNTTVSVGVNSIIEKAPMVLDWSVGVLMRESNEPRVNCSKAKKNVTSYVCQSNTKCVDSEAGGYHCHCLDGYEGNPYLKPGCRDVDECATANNPCSMACDNTLGSYICSCPKGYTGDGKKSGTGCVKILNKNSSTLKRITLGLGISLGTILLLFIGWWFSSIIKKRRIIKQKAKNFERNGGLILKQQMATDESVVARMKIFTSDDLDRATDHFNEDRIIGRGGQGTVYKGMLSQGKIVAIKKSETISETQIVGFINEVVILSQINHRNVVKLLGCCLETEVPLLVYEFIPNGTLYHHIHNPSEEFPITWKMRLQIASDAAGALAYLHSSSHIPILHRDIKSSNILLDEKYRAKVSDFGTSRSIAIDKTHVTTRVMGTFGYLDPQYFQSSVFTEKSDVYSFGVVLVELLTGQKAVLTSLEEDKNLSAWFLTHMENSSLLEIIDPLIIQEGSNEEFHSIAKLASKCLNLDRKKRPTMKEVLIEIEGVIAVHIPKQMVTGTVNYNVYDNNSASTSLFSSSQFTNTSTSAEMTLLFSPR